MNFKLGCTEETFVDKSPKFPAMKKTLEYGTTHLAQPETEAILCATNTKCFLWICSFFEMLLKISTFQLWHH